MNKLLAITVAAMTLLALPQAGHAQKGSTTATSKNTTTSGAIAGAEAVGAVFMPGAISAVPGGAAGAASAAASVGGFNQPQLVMNTGSAPSTGTFNDCGIAWSGGLWLLTASVTSESEDCKSQRQAIFAATHLGSRPIAFESMCAIKAFREAVERTNEPQCAATVAARAKAQPTMAAQPMVTQPVRVASTLPANCAEQTVGGKTFITCQ